MKTRGGPDAFYADDALPLVNRGDIEHIKTTIPDTRFGRTRLCVHKSDTDKLQEMFIVLDRATYIRPHKHIGKVESLLVLEGAADAVFFDEAGGIVRVARLGDYASGREFFYRIDDDLYHTLLIHTPSLVFKEATLGPFDRSATIFAPWSPPDSDAIAARSYMTHLATTVRRDTDHP